MGVLVEVTTYTVSILPRDHPDRDEYEITVEYRGPDAWAVMHGRWCLRRDGEWTYEPQPSSRNGEYLAEHRHTLTQALGMAEREAPGVALNGVTAREALDRWRERAGASA